MFRDKTTFNKFDSNKKSIFSNGELYRLMYCTENTLMRNISENFEMNREIIRGTKL